MTPPPFKQELSKKSFYVIAKERSDRRDPLDFMEIATPREACPGDRTGLAMTLIIIIGLFGQSLETMPDNPMSVPHLPITSAVRDWPR